MKLKTGFSEHNIETEKICKRPNIHFFFLEMKVKKLEFWKEKKKIGGDDEVLQHVV